MAYATTVSKWGNSEAVRIPRDLLRAVGLSEGDMVKVSATSHGNIQITPERREHRRVKPDPSITYETLFEGYAPSGVLQEKSWGNDDMVGSEWKAWS